MTAITTWTTVGELVADRPSRSRVFQKLGIDFCCGGKRPLEDVCREKNLDAQMILDVMLNSEASNSHDGTVNPVAMSLTELCDHIEQTHHAYLREELPRLGHMAYRVANAHGQNHTWTIALNNTFVNFAEELSSHMQKEEQILFPVIRRLEAGEPNAFGHCGGSVSNPIAVMEAEHDHAGNALEQFRSLSSDYTAPEGACNTFRALLDGLRELEADMHQHVHKENNILFPKAIALESSPK